MKIPIVEKRPSNDSLSFIAAISTTQKTILTEKQTLFFPRESTAFLRGLGPALARPPAAPTMGPFLALLSPR